MFLENINKNICPATHKTFKAFHTELERKKRQKIIFKFFKVRSEYIFNFIEEKKIILFLPIYSYVFPDQKKIFLYFYISIYILNVTILTRKNKQVYILKTFSVLGQNETVVMQVSIFIHDLLQTFL